MILWLLSSFKDGQNAAVIYSHSVFGFKFIRSKRGYGREASVSLILTMVEEQKTSESFVFQE